MEIYGLGSVLALRIWCGVKLRVGLVTVQTTSCRQRPEIGLTRLIFVDTAVLFRISAKSSYEHLPLLSISIFLSLRLRLYS